jgi:hypothetical protein
MGKRLGIREAKRAAADMAAAMVENEDFYSLFGDELCERADAQPDGNDILGQAQQEVAARIRKVFGGAADGR